MAPPALKRSLTSSITAELRDAILQGTYPAGSQLRQDALAQSFGVSRIPVREALFQLDAEGLVRITPQKGAVVSELSELEIRDVFELRAILEPRLLRRSLALIDLAGLDLAGDVHERFVVAAEENNMREWGALNAQFHNALFAAADMPRTATTVAALLQTSDRYTRIQLNTPQAMKRAVEEHAALLALCRAGEVDAACAALRRHVSFVGKKLLQVIRGRRPDRDRSDVTPA
jgi:DNA-binding GntR family transcriptional regulator